jgi:hypothetical protein
MTTKPAVPLSGETDEARTLWARRLFGALRIVAGLLVLAALLTQIVDDSLHHAFKPGQYFAYFTIESSMMNVAVLLFAGVQAFRRPCEGERLTSIRASILAYAVVTGLVYNLLLRNLPPVGYQGIQWPNEILHVWVPIFIVIDFFLAPGRRRIPWRRLWWVASYPLAWLAFTMVRGSLTGWYPYPFLEPSGPGGYAGILLYVLGIAALILGIGSLAIASTRRLRT